MKKIRELFDSLTPAQKKVTIMALVMTAIGCILLLGYYYKMSGREKVAVKEPAKEINIDTNLLDKAYNDSIEEGFKKRDEELKNFKKLMENLEQKVEHNRFSMEKKVSSPDGSDGSGEGGPSMPFPPPPSSGTQSFGRAAGLNPFTKSSVDPPKPVGGIEMIGEGEAGRTLKARKREAEASKKQKRSVYLPPSFMEATLLTGFSAATMHSSKTYEKPLLLRVKDLSILPNDVKTDLKGCFIMASAYGDLSDERAHARLVNLSCVGRNGESVIDAGIKGFIVDSDGKIGMSGNVVTKLGALLGRSVVAGFFGGVGDALSASSTTTSVSSLGSTQTIDTGDLANAGIGGGLSEGFGELQKFYLDMAKQTFPVIEVGATKKVTVVIEQGVELNIEDYCIGGFNKCAEN